LFFNFSDLRLWGIPLNVTGVAMHGSKPEKLVHPANEYLQDEKGHHLSAVNSPCGGLFEFLALKGLHRVAQGI